VSPGDIVVADEEGIVVVPKRRSAEVLEAAQKRAKKDAAQTLDEWEAAHRSRIDEILRNKGFAG
jgi:regulator of RNase E activity RraA